MKKLLMLCLFPFMMRGQARLNKSEEEVRSTLPDVKFTEGITNDGYKYLMAPLDRGTFIYYFDEFGYTNMNLMVPYTYKDANEQAEIYNKKYTIVSKTSWTAYLEGGSIMTINMIYDDELNKFIFRYSF